MRVLFFGMTGRFSIPPLATLLSNNVDVCAVIVPGERSSGTRPQPILPPDLPVVNPYAAPNIIHLAWKHRLPAWSVNSLSTPETLTLLADLQPDLIVVACFSRIFPPALLKLPRHGCLNLHPSLLPTYRGPAPLFWIARFDERITGVTLHFLDEGVDSGPIVARATLERPDGLSGAELDHQGAEVGAALLLSALDQLETGSLSSQPQNEAEASYFPWPSPADFVISTSWSAQRAFNFLHGAEDWPLVVETGATRFLIRAALSYAPDHNLEKPYTLLGDELWVQFQPGVLRAKVALEK